MVFSCSGLPNNTCTAGGFKAVGHLLDFRFQVTDTVIAKSMMISGYAVYIIDEATGTKLPIPVSKVGHLRGTGTKPQADRVYAAIFANNQKVLKKGRSMTVVILDFRAEHLVVE